MAYETYDAISWADGTPLTSDRLQQMSTNIGLVKTVTDGYSKGVLSWNEETSFSTSREDHALYEIIALKNIGGLDLRVTAEANRYIRFTFVIPGVYIENGDENQSYFFRLIEGTASGGSMVQEWLWVPEGGDVIVADDNITVQNAAKLLNGGVMTVMHKSGATGITTQAYTVWMGRSGGTAAYRPQVNNGAKVQLWAEDCGSY